MLIQLWVHPNHYLIIFNIFDCTMNSWYQTKYHQNGVCPPYIRRMSASLTGTCPPHICRMSAYVRRISADHRPYIRRISAICPPYLITNFSGPCSPMSANLIPLRIFKVFEIYGESRNAGWIRGTVNLGDVYIGLMIKHDFGVTIRYGISKDTLNRGPVNRGITVACSNEYKKRQTRNGHQSINSHTTACTLPLTDHSS